MVARRPSTPAGRALAAATAVAAGPARPAGQHRAVFKIGRARPGRNAPTCSTGTAPGCRRHDGAVEAAIEVTVETEVEVGAEVEVGIAVEVEVAVEVAAFAASSWTSGTRASERGSGGSRALRAASARPALDR